jgi:hypothetical protein
LVLSREVVELDPEQLESLDLVFRAVALIQELQAENPLQALQTLVVTSAALGFICCVLILCVSCIRFVVTVFSS